MGDRDLPAACLQLVQEETLLARISGMEHWDMFWQEGRFEPTPAFEEVRPMFDRELAIVQQDQSDWDEFEAARHRSRSSFSMWRDQPAAEV